MSLYLLLLASMMGAACTALSGHHQSDLNKLHGSLHKPPAATKMLALLLVHILSVWLSFS